MNYAKERKVEEKPAEEPKTNNSTKNLLPFGYQPPTLIGISGFPPRYYRPVKHYLKPSVKMSQERLPVGEVYRVAERRGKTVIFCPDNAEGQGKIKATAFWPKPVTQSEPEDIIAFYSAPKGATAASPTKKPPPISETNTIFAKLGPSSAPLSQSFSSLLR